MRPAEAAGRMPSPSTEWEPKALSLQSPSMEWEPKALSLQELKYAREAALYVLNTHSSEDAARIFTEGLEPVLGTRKNSMDSDDDYDEDGDMFDPDAFVGDHDDIPRQYARTPKKRDVVTAPF